ncbi:MAG: prolipoprotein diacylglyceryl transferase [Ignavibacteriales bacterium]|nr:prolipoprotein diacylglyceryl transferase [Ignavibacteriales bacterium]
MCPKLFQIGPFPVYGYGLMLALGFITASYLLTNEFKRHKLDPNLASNITLIALIGGVVGSKLLYLFEHWSFFVADPFGMAFSPGGLTFYGGLILAALSIYVYGRMKKIPFAVMADSTAPGLILAYGIGRLGCQLAGDGDYGFPTTLPWGTDYSRGTFPPSQAFRDFPEITSRFPGGVVPDNVLCHPTPVYEFLICAALFVILWKLRTHIAPAGRLFSLYLVFAGTERFTIEFFRINPRLIWGLSEAHLISIVLIASGTLSWMLLKNKSSTSLK